MDDREYNSGTAEERLRNVETSLSQEIKKKWKIQESMVSILIKKSVILRTQSVSSLATLEKQGIGFPTKDERKGKQL
jgi:hypothetical protein